MSIKTAIKHAAVITAMLSFSSQAATVTKVVNGSFDKPVIFVEGYDPDNRFSFSDYQDRLGSTFFSDLARDGRDFVFIDFNNGGAAIESNANELVAAINQVNSQKVGSHPNAVVGFSMGGLVARWALKDMEDRGLDHNTSLYISFDAPHRGANVPYDIKTNIDHMYEKVKKYSVNQFKIPREVIYSPAGKQMIMWGTDSANFYRSLESKGYPNNLRRVAFANGSSTSQTQGLYQGQMALDYKYELLQSRQYRKSLKTNVMRVCNYPCNPVGYAHVDNAAGSTFPSFARLRTELKNADANISAALLDIDIFSDNTDNMATNFIPTVSALDIKGHDYDDDISSSSLRFNESPFDETYVSSSNYPHESFTQWSYYLNNELRNYHQDGLSAPSRSHKSTPLADIGFLQSEWFNGGRYGLEWPTVAGATHYEIYRTSQYSTMFGGSPVKTVSGNFTIFTVDITSKIAIRACNADTCSYPKIKTLVKRSSNLNPY